MPAHTEWAKLLEPKKAAAKDVVDKANSIASDDVGVYLLNLANKYTHQRDITLSPAEALNNDTTATKHSVTVQFPDGINNKGIADLEDHLKSVFEDKAIKIQKYKQFDTAVISVTGESKKLATEIALYDALNKPSKGSQGRIK